MERLVWKAVPGYDGYYEVSNTGQVRSVEHYVNALKGSRRLIKPSIKKQRIERDKRKMQTHERIFHIICLN